MTTTYRVNLHTPRKPSPLNPASRKPLPTAKVPTERNGRNQDASGQGEGTRRSRTVSPAQRILRRRAAKTLQTNTLRRQVEVYEANALRGLATKRTSSTASKTAATLKGKGKEPQDGNIRIGITVTTSSTQHSSKKKRRRRWGAFWMFLRARPVVAALGSLWPFESRTTPELEWRPGESAAPVAAAAAA